MKTRAATATFILLAATLAWAPDAASAGPVPHAPIAITSDAGFTFSNGVVAGSGTAADPYVIRGWLIDAPTGSAIRITGTTKHVLVEANVLSAKSGATVVDVKDNAGQVVLRDNTVNHRGFGLYAQGGSTIVASGVFRDAGSFTFAGAAVYAKGGHVLVANATFVDNDQAVRAIDADVNVTASLVVSGWEGFDAAGGTLVLHDVEVQVDGAAVDARAVADLRVEASLLTSPTWGVLAQSSVATLADVRVEQATKEAVVLVDSRSDVTALSVAGGGTGLVVHDGRAVVASSDFDSVAGIAVRYVGGAGSVTGSTFLRNGGGVAVDQASLVALDGNVFSSNKWGVGIDYASRASIPLLGSNLVNGHPLAGVYRWLEADVVFTGSVDSGHSAGFAGSLTREGLLVLYDVQEASVVGATLAHGTVGVHAVNSFNVVVEGSLLLSNVCGVRFNGTVGFVKNSTIDIPVDPPLTCGVTIDGGFAGVLNNTIQTVDVGVVVAGTAKVNVSGNTVSQTYVGISVVGGSERNVTLHGNVLVGNQIGLEIKSRFRGTVEANVVADNARAGVRIEGGAAFTFKSNVVVDNLRGVEDLTACAAATVSSRFEGNVVANNTDFGMMVNGTVVLRDNRFEDNGGDGAVVCGRAEARANVYARNGADGLEVRGSAQLEADAYVDNRFGAGLRIRGTLFVVLYANVSGNLDGVIGVEPLPELPPPPPLPPVGVPRVPCVCPNVPPPDPLWIHLSKIHGNARFAISTSPQTDVNATHNWWGNADGPDLWVPQYGEFGNVVSPNVRFVPWYRDAAMTDRAPV